MYFHACIGICHTVHKKSARNLYKRILKLLMQYIIGRTCNGISFLSKTTETPQFHIWDSVSSAQDRWWSSVLSLWLQYCCVYISLALFLSLSSSGSTHLLYSLRTPWHTKNQLMKQLWRPSLWKTVQKIGINSNTIMLLGGVPLHQKRIDNL